MIDDWDAAYLNSATVADANAFFTEWARAAAAFRRDARGESDIAYGGHPRERFDLFMPGTAPKGLMVFVHGGYWKALDRDSFSHLGAGALAHGWAVAMIGYPLCPDARIAGITRSVARGVEAAARRVAGPIALSGHSAGGHLAARMICADSALAPEVLARVRRVVGISGVYDLRPLRRTAMNEILRIDAAEARAESPALLDPVAGVDVALWVGGAELPEFRRQTALLANVWTGVGARTEAAEAPGAHHYDIVDPLADPHSAMVGRLVAAAPQA
jgi:acetyl esterase/lipase